MGIYKDYGWNSQEFTCAHNYLLPSIMQMLSKTDDFILDVGCGNGAIANYLINQGYNVYGTDASDKGIQLANKVNQGRFFKQDLSEDSLPYELNNIPFRTIISTEVVEHLYDPRKYIDLCKTVLIKSGGGQIIISTPYHGYFKNVVLAITGKMDKHFTALWDGGHIKFWSRASLTILLNEFGFEVVEFKGSGRIPYVWKSMVIRATIKV
jgi:2-polyprenyl-3-methyl-5-hydroxy-6-metoxy-1,4-benzoquinol methylase